MRLLTSGMLERLLDRGEFAWSHADIASDELLPLHLDDRALINDLWSHLARLIATVLVVGGICYFEVLQVSYLDSSRDGLHFLLLNDLAVLAVEARYAASRGECPIR